MMAKSIIVGNSVGGGIEVPQARMAMAVQWHPELMDIDASRRLFSLLVDNCRHSGQGLVI